MSRRLFFGEEKGNLYIAADLVHCASELQNILWRDEYRTGSRYYLLSCNFKYEIGGSLERLEESNESLVAK